MVRLLLNSVVLIQAILQLDSGLLFDDYCWQNTPSCVFAERSVADTLLLHAADLAERFDRDILLELSAALNVLFIIAKDRLLWFVI